MLRCSDIADRADGFIEGTLPLRGRLSVRLHLAMCVDCRRFIRRMRSMMTNLSMLRENPSVQPELVDQIISRIELPALPESGSCACGAESPH